MLLGRVGIEELFVLVVVLMPADDLHSQHRVRQIFNLEPLCNDARRWRCVIDEVFDNAVLIHPEQVPRGVLHQRQQGRIAVNPAAEHENCKHWACAACVHQVQIQNLPVRYRGSDDFAEVPDVSSTLRERGDACCHTRQDAPDKLELEPAHSRVRQWADALNLIVAVFWYVAF